MLDSVRNMKTSEIELRRGLTEIECRWLAGQLRAKRAVAVAECSADTRLLHVEYDADLVGSGDLVDFLDDWGVPVVAVHAAQA
jgi:hypothetical protein